MSNIENRIDICTITVATSAFSFVLPVRETHIYFIERPWPEQNVYTVFIFFLENNLITQPNSYICIDLFERFVTENT